MNLRIILSCLLLISFGCKKEIDKTTRPSVEVSKSNTPLFRLISQEQSGITHQHQTHPTDQTGLLSGGGGVAAGDINNDGLPDLLFSTGFFNCKLYLNQGNLTFKDVTASSGLGVEGPQDTPVEGVNLVDINGDGWLDIYLLKNGLEINPNTRQFTKRGANLLYINQQNGTFSEQSEKYGLDIIGLSQSAQFFDYDNDGDLDVYIIQTPETGPAFNFSYYESQPAARWLNDQFLENIEGKRFVDVREKAGIRYARNLGLSAAIGDINQDGWMDIYVANDFLGRDFLYVNQGNKRFKESWTDYFSKSSLSAMGTDFGDINQDGWPDLFVGEMLPVTPVRQKTNVMPFSIEIYDQFERQNSPQYTRNTLHLNRAGKDMREIGQLAGVEATEWSWSSFFFDADLDGKQDLFVPNGIKKDMTDMDFIKFNFGSSYAKIGDPQAVANINMQEAPASLTPNHIFQNQGELRFVDVSQKWGITQKIHTRGATYADLDQDGDTELILNNLDQIPSIYENLSRQHAKPSFLGLRFAGDKLNTQGIGVHAKAYTDGQLQMKYVSNQRGFQSGPPPQLIFGLGQAQKIDSLIIEWPGGRTQVIYNQAVNQFLTIKESDAKPQKRAVQQKPTLLVEVPKNQQISFTHKEQAFNDFRQERLLYRIYSKEGPALDIADVNGDGLQDVFVGGAIGSRGRLFLQQPNGSFRPSPSQPWATDPSFEEISAHFFDVNGDQAPDLYIGSGSNELANDTLHLADRLFINNGQGNFSQAELPELFQSTSCLASHDVDGDGDLDLFVGSLLSVGNYGKVPPSHLLINEGGKLLDKTAEIAPSLLDLGRVRDAKWISLDGKRDAELIIVGEWMSIAVFAWQNGQLVRQARPAYADWTGLWNCITNADFDQDGDQDLVLGNWGLNSPFTASKNAPLTLLTADFDDNGALDPLIFHYKGGKSVPFVNRDLFTSQMPVFNKKYQNFSDYALATLETIFPPEQLNQAVFNHINELRSAYLENTGDGSFRFHPLPWQAQVAPVNDILPFDVNQDGTLDIVLVGNLMGNHFEYGDIDALEGLVLLGDGKGNFKALSSSESGFRVPGMAQNIRKIQMGSESSEARLIIGNNNGPLQVYRANDFDR